MPVVRWIAGAFLALASAAHAQGRVIQGVVVDSSGAPVPYANIIATGSLRRVAADAEGRFRIPMDSSARRELEVKRIGYHPLLVNLDPWPDTAIRVVLAVAARTLSAITVAVERSQSLAIHGFYERMNDVERGINHGFFVTPEEIENRKGARLTDFVVAMPAIRVTLVKAGGFRDQRTGWEIQGIDGCQMTVYVDGVRFHSLSQLKNTRDQNHIFINDLVTPGSVAGIEVYPRSVTAPPKYQSLNGTCGIVLIWTR